MISPLDSPHHRPTTPMPSDEAEHVAERQADEPVAGEVPEHRRARIAEPAQRAGRDRLDAVEQLKDRGDTSAGDTPTSSTPRSCVNAPISRRGTDEERRAPRRP